MLAMAQIFFIIFLSIKIHSYNKQQKKNSKQNSYRILFETNIL